MLSHTKYRLKKYFWLGMVAISTAVGLHYRTSWLVCASMFCVAVSASYEYGVVCENWRFKDVANYLKREGFI